MKILVVGSSNTFYVVSYLHFFSNLDNVEVGFFNISDNSAYEDESLNFIINLYKDNKKLNLFSPLKRFANKIGLFNNSFLRWLLNCVRKKKSNLISEKDVYFLESFKPDIVFCFWGTTISPYIDFIKLKNPCSKFILSINTYPTTFSYSTSDFLSDSNYFNKFDALIFPTKAMFTHFEKNNLFKSMGHCIVNPDFISSKITDELKEKKYTGLSKVIFLGNVNFSDRKTDDVRKQFDFLISKDIEIFIQEGHSTPDHPLIKTFKAFDYNQILNGDLNRFINNNFDAVFYAYNSSGSLRESLSLTTRFSLCEFSKTPILLERNKFDGIVSQFKNVVPLIEYDIKDNNTSNFSYTPSIRFSGNELEFRKKAILDHFTLLLEHS